VTGRPVDVVDGTAVAGTGRGSHTTRAGAALSRTARVAAMRDSRIFGVIASSALVLGALAGARLRIPKRVLAAMPTFAAGALITALSSELFEDSYERGGIWRAAAGLIAGAVVLTLLSQRLDRLAQGRREATMAARSSTPTPRPPTRPPPLRRSAVPPAWPCWPR
jgi:hypothetical protein